NLGLLQGCLLVHRRRRYHRAVAVCRHEELSAGPEREVPQRHAAPGLSAALQHAFLPDGAGTNPAPAAALSESKEPGQEHLLQSPEQLLQSPKRERRALSPRRSRSGL